MRKLFSTVLAFLFFVAFAYAVNNAIVVGGKLWVSSNKAVMSSSIPGPDYGDDFVFTVLTAASDTFTLPLRTGFNYDMTVDWGDGSASSTVTSFDDPDRVHSYDGAGERIVRISGTCEAWYFNNTGDRLLFRSIIQWGDVGFTGDGLASAFYGCSSTTNFGPQVTGATGVATLYRTWRYCSSSTTFPDVSGLTNVNSLYSAWEGCTAAPSFPDVSGLPNVTTMRFAWYGCSGCLTVPTLPASSSLLDTVESAFRNVGAGMTGTVVELWNTSNFTNISSFANCFTGATGLDNYADIPDAWKGL